MIEVVSIELTQLCAKACKFCYSKSTPDGETEWSPMVLAGFVDDLVRNGVKAVSFGGGEPLQYWAFWNLMEMLRGVPVFKSMTTNGLPLSEDRTHRLAKYLDKVHVSIHFPENEVEVDRVIRQVSELEKSGLKSGINFVVRGTEADKKAVVKIRDAGIGAERVVFLPMRMGGAVDLVKFKEVASILDKKFQSMTCLLKCGESPRFVSISWDGKAGKCSYTPAKTLMKETTYAGMVEAVDSKSLVYCG